MFFAKTLIERTPKNHLRKHPSTQNHPQVVICNEYWPTSKYQVKRRKNVYLGKTEIWHFVHVFLFIILFCFTDLQPLSSTFPPNKNLHSLTH